MGVVMVVIDATMLLLFLQPGTRGPADASGQPIAHGRERILALITELEKKQEKLLIPTPALAEALVKTDLSMAQPIVDTIREHAVFGIESFDLRAAMEVAAMSREVSKRKLKASDPAATWAKLKYDRQIVAIAKVNGASTIYTDDSDLKTLARSHGLEAIGLAELDLPADKQQPDLFADPSSD